MTAELLACATALWLGVMTSISPCPLATNIAAVSVISRRIAHPLWVLLAGSAYTLGRVCAYTAVGWLVSSSLLALPSVAQFLQSVVAKALGPLLIVMGVVLLEWVTFSLPGLSLKHEHHAALAEAGAPGAFALGALFALAFCPVSAALFFGSLIPMIAANKGGLLLPAVYGIGTGLPVLFVAVALAAGVKTLGHWFTQVSLVEKCMRRVIGAVMVFSGIWQTYSVVW